MADKAMSAHASEVASKTQELSLPAVHDQSLMSAWLRHRDRMRAASERAPRDYVDFDSYRLESDATSHPREYTFRLLISDHVRELIGLLNRWRFSNASLTAWSQELETHDEQTQIDLLWEFVWPLAESTLSIPYRAKQALAFSACHALDFLQPLDARPLDDKSIGLGTLRTHAADHPTALSLVVSMQGLNSEPFRAATGDFRNSLHHRLPPGVEVGFRSTVKRFVEPSAIGFSFSVLPPLPLATIIQELGAEQRRAVRAFEQYWALVRKVETALRGG